MVIKRLLLCQQIELLLSLRCFSDKNKVSCKTYLCLWAQDLPVNVGGFVWVRDTDSINNNYLFIYLTVYFIILIDGYGKMSTVEHSILNFRVKIRVRFKIMVSVSTVT